MKKLFALMLALCLLCGCAAMAEEASTITWEEVAPTVEASGVTGEFQLLEGPGLAVWVPTGMLAAEVSEEDAAAGRLALFIAEDQSGYFAVDAVNVPDMTLDQFFANAQESAAEEVELLNVNGLSGVVYKDPTNDLWSFSLVDTNSNVINFIMGPASEEGSKEVFSIVLASIQPYEQ